MNSKNTKIVASISLLLAVIITLGLFGFSCVSGMTPVGWSGGAVSNDILYVGSMEGRLAAVNLTDESRIWAEPLKLPSQGGLFGCTSALTCGGTSARVPIYGTPVVSDNIVYIAGYNGKVYAYNTLNLAEKWVFPRGDYLSAFVGGMVIEQNKLFIGCSDGVIYCLDASTGDLIASYQTGEKIWGTPALVDNTLFIGSFDKTFYAFDATDLTLKWTYDTEGSIIATPLVSDGIVYIGSFDKKLYALDVDNGSLKWSFEGGNWFWTQPIIVNDMLYAGCLDGIIYVLNPANGAEIKKFDLPEIFQVSRSGLSSRPVAIDDHVFFATQDGYIYKIDTTTQEILQIIALTGTIDGPLMAYEGIIYFQTQDIAMQRVDAATGALLQSISLISG